MVIAISVRLRQAVKYLGWASFSVGILLMNNIHSIEEGASSHTGLVR